MVAFQQRLTRNGKSQLRSVIAERMHTFARRVLEWLPVPAQDVDKVSYFIEAY